MFDFTDYTLNELTAIDNFLCYTRAMAAEHVDENDIHRVRRELLRMHRCLSKTINNRLDEEAEKWDRSHRYAASEAPDPPADEPAPPDMFGWVGDALDDLCAAGEVIGNDR